MNPLSSLPAPAQDVVKRAFLTLIHSLVAVAVANQGAGVPVSAQSSTVIAGLAAAVSVLWHGLPALIGAAKAKRLTKQLSVLATIEAQVRATVVAEQVRAVVADEQQAKLVAAPVVHAPVDSPPIP